jgi:hypothetical protein
MAKAIAVGTTQIRVTATVITEDPSGNRVVVFSDDKPEVWQAVCDVQVVANSDIITFADPEVKRLCVANWDTNGDGELSKAEAAAVTDLGKVFKNQFTIKSFNELQYFTGLMSIGEYAFYFCRRLASIIIPNSVTSIGPSAFLDCGGLTSIEIINSIKVIGSYAFGNCSGLTSITIPSSVTNIEYFAFYKCSGLTSIVIPNSVTNIGINPFWGCTNLKEIHVQSNNANYVSIDGVLFSTGREFIVSYPNAKGSTYTIPNSVTYILNYAFGGCIDLTSITIPNSVTNIGHGAFECCGLTSITIPKSVTSVENYTFSGCKGLTSITIPNSITSIGFYAFLL